MPNFDTYLARHGECWITDLIERMERYNGIHSDICAPLELRWERVMHVAPAANGNEHTASQAA